MNRTLTRNTFLKIVTCALAAVAAVLSTAATARAQIEPIRPLTFDSSAVGVARGQAARLSAFYRDLLPPGPCAPDTTCTAPASFRATLSFLDDVGNVVAQRAVTLSPERGATLVYAPSSFRPDGRATVRANVSVEPDSGYLPRLVPTVEVLDNASGQTSVLNPGALADFQPQPEQPGDFHFGLFNVVQGQTARVQVSNVGAPSGLPPGPCRADVTFYDGEGRVLGRETLWLAPGQTLASDFSTAGMAAGWRGRIRADVHAELLEGRGGAATVALSLELFASDTGRGMLFYPGALIGLL